MDSSTIRQKARETLKQLPGKYKLFLLPLLLFFLQGGLSVHLNHSLANGTPPNQAFPQVLSFILSLAIISAAYTLLEVLRGQRQDVDYADSWRAFHSPHIFQLFLLYLVKILLLLPWALLMIVPIFISTLLIAITHTENLLPLLIALIPSVIGLILLIIKSFSYSQAQLILYDHLEHNDPIDHFAIIKESKQLMAGQKTAFFVLHLSFIGWILLIPFTLGLLTIYLIPYITTAQVVFYDNLVKTETLEK